MRVTNRSTRGVSNVVGRDPRPTISDLLLPISVVLWIVGVHRIHPSPVPLAILPAGSVVVFLAGLGVLIVSTGLLLTRHKFSSHRMALHLGTLIVMLYGTAPIVYPEPRFAWLYKHIAITNYIAVHHVLSRSMDIYRIWPGFFALTAWIDKVAGVSTPLVYASWAELFFEIIYVLELAWIFRALELDERERWLALFLFAGAKLDRPGLLLPAGLRACAQPRRVRNGTPLAQERGATLGLQVRTLGGWFTGEEALTPIRQVDAPKDDDSAASS